MYQRHFHRRIFIWLNCQRHRILVWPVRCYFDWLPTTPECYFGANNLMNIKLIFPFQLNNEMYGKWPLCELKKMYQIKKKNQKIKIITKIKCLKVLIAFRHFKWFKWLKCKEADECQRNIRATHLTHFREGKTFVFFLWHCFHWHFIVNAGFIKRLATYLD